MTLKNSKTKNDIILTFVFLILAVALFGFIKITEKKGAYAVVSRNGVEIARYSLAQDREVRLENENGGYNILVIKDGKADVIEASCPDKICVNQKPISMTGETITCLPNKTIVTIEAEGADEEIDFVT